MSVNRRELLRRSGLAAGALGMPAFLRAAAAGAQEEGALPVEVTSTEVVFALFGGVANEARERAYFDSFTEATGIEVSMPLWDWGKFVTMCTEGPQQWDTIDADGFSAIWLLNEGLIQPFPEWVAPCDLVPEEFADYFRGGYAYSVQMGWKPDAFEGDGPRTWADFWDVERFPGKRGWPSAVYAGTLEAALLADGVAPDEVYPLDWDRAFAKLDELREHFVFYDLYSQGTQALLQGSISILATANGRLYELVGKEQPISFSWEQAILYPASTMPIPNNAPHPDAAFALAHWMSDPARQAAFAEEMGYGPTVSAAFDLLDEETLALLPNSPANAEVAFTVDTGYLAEIDGEYFQRYVDWVSGA